MRWNLGQKTIDCTKPRVIAIVNASPDSFYTGSRLARSPQAQREMLITLLDAKPDVVDVGGQSTRPGSTPVGAIIELQRVIPVIKLLRGLDAQVPITIDTFHAAVAQEALSAGADGVNDISAGRLDSTLLDLVAERGCGYVLMHMKGTPATMQQQPHYDDCVGEVFGFLKQRLAMIEGFGIAPDSVVVDPGIGFGKRVEDNLALIRDTSQLARLERPLLYGVSRKSFIGALAKADDPARRLPGTLGVIWHLLSCGVMLHRVHDPAEVRQLITIWTALVAEKRAGNKDNATGS